MFIAHFEAFLQAGVMDGGQELDTKRKKLSK